MGRPERRDFEGAWHHVMNRGAGRQRTFFTRRDGDQFEHLMGEGHDRFAVEVHAYCLMPNHFHLLVHCPAGNLARFMQHISSVYTRSVNERRETDGPLFRGRYHSLVVDDDRYLMSAARYIHRNPLALASDATAIGHRWSSHAVYLGARARPRWLFTGKVLDMFAGGVDSYRDFVDDRTSSELAAFPDRHLLDFIELVVDEHGAAYTGGRQRLHRMVALALIDQCEPSVGRRLESTLGFAEPWVLAQSKQRANDRLDQSPEFAHLVHLVQRRVA